MMKWPAIRRRTIDATFVLLLIVAYPVMIFGASAVKGKHIISVYSDGAGEEAKQLRLPAGVGCYDSSRFVVADTANGRLLQYELRDGTVNALAKYKVSQLLRPTKVMINSKGAIYALDGKKRRIVLLRPDGEFHDYIEPKGLPSPESFVPKSFTLDRNDNIYILDIYSNRVMVLNSEAEYQRQIEFPEDFGYFSDVAIDFKGDILLLDSTDARVYSAAKNAAGFTPMTESLRSYLRYPTNITTDGRGRMYLLDRNGGQIVVFGQDGSFLAHATGWGWKEGLLRHPSQMCLNRKGQLFVADTDNNRVQIFQLLQ